MRVIIVSVKFLLTKSAHVSYLLLFRWNVLSFENISVMLDTKDKYNE